MILRVCVVMVCGALVSSAAPEFTLVHTLTGHTSYVDGLVFSADGRQVISGSWDGTVRFWDLESGREVRKIQAHVLPVIAIALSPALLASGSDDQTVKLWDLKTGKAVHTLRGHNAYVLSVAFSPDGKRLASADAFGMILEWDVESGRQVRVYEGHELAVFSVAYSGDGKLLASASRDASARIWDVESGKTLQKLTKGFRPHLVPRSVRFAPDGKALITGGGAQVRLWDVATGNEIRAMTQGQDKPYSFLVAPNAEGSWIASGTGEGLVKIWDAGSGQLLSTLEGKVENGIEALAVSGDARWIAAGGDDNAVKVWRVK
jgi:WD40 repeat protein